MSFATLLEQTAKSSTSQNNILTDGQFTVPYAALPGLLAMFADYFVHQGSGRNGCLAVECPNSVPGALTLLYLLQQELSFVLLPPSEQEEQASEWKPIPRFCHYRLVVKRASAETAAEWGHRPEHFLLLEANRTYQQVRDAGQERERTSAHVKSSLVCRSNSGADGKCSAPPLTEAGLGRTKRLWMADSSCVGAEELAHLVI